jgi:hypothetical protein
LSLQPKDKLLAVIPANAGIHLTTSAHFRRSPP